MTVVEAPPKPPPPLPNPEPEVPGRYRDRFILYWDYLLNLLKKYEKVQVMYGVYNKGTTLLQP